MTTESPMRMVESRGARNWPSSKGAATFGLPFKNMATEELGLLLKEHKFHGDQSDTIPNRSGSAPPSMEGSFAAIRNLLAQQNPSLNSSLTSLRNAIENCVPEEQLRFDPAYFVYYCSNVNLNPRLPPPVISRENQHLVRHIEGLGNNRRFTSLDDSTNGSLHLSRGSLFTHKEEPEDDRSPRQASNDWAESALMARQSTALTGRNKSLVDLIQEDFPRTPSPVYNQSRSSSNSTTEEPIDHDVHASSVNIPSINTSKQSESNSGAVHVCLDTCTLDAHAIGEISSDDPLAASLPCMPCPDGTESSPPSQKDELGNRNSGFEDDASISSTPGLGVSRTESRASASNVDNSRNKQEEHQSYKRNIPQHHPSSQQGTLNQVRGAQAEVMSQGMNYSYSGMEKLSHSHPKSSVEGQPTLHSSGFTPPLYANAAAYMTSGSPFYSNFQPPGLFSPQYSMGGYAPSSALLPPFMAGYSSHGAFPMPFDATSGPSYSGRAVGVSTEQNIPHVGDLQHPSKFYGQHGLMMQPSFVDPLQMLYFQHPSQDAYGASGQFGMSVSGCLIGSPVNPSVPQKEPVFAAYMGDQNLHPPTNGSLSIPNQRKGEITGTNYYRSFPSMGVMSQFPASPHASSVMPSSPVGGTNHLGRQNEMRFSQGSIRNAGVYFGWQGHRGVVNSDDPKRHSFLEELKSSNARRFELSDISGRIVEVCVDQHGSRFIQKKLENCSIEEKASVFKEVILHAPKLMTDVFGNYVIQKFFEHGSPEQRRQLADQLTGQMLPLSLQMYGCRVIQKALEVIEVDQKTQLAHELDGHVMRCVRDQNGNHVIQKCIECLPIEKLGFIISAFQGQVPTLATHPYGCRVVQRVLEHCSDDTKIQCIMDEILESACVLAQDQYGNYVTQHVLERGKPNERSQIISQLTGKIVHLSRHKYSSNVVEKCLEHGDTAERQLLIEEIIGQSEENDNLLAMMKDQFANYVVQKILEICNDEQREVLVNRMRVHFHALKKYTYGKHIVARFEQLSGEESQASEP